MWSSSSLSGWSWAAKKQACLAWGYGVDVFSSSFFCRWWRSAEGPHGTKETVIWARVMWSHVTVPAGWTRPFGRNTSAGSARANVPDDGPVAVDVTVPVCVWLSDGVVEWYGCCCWVDRSVEPVPVLQRCKDLARNRRVGRRRGSPLDSMSLVSGACLVLVVSTGSPRGFALFVSGPVFPPSRDQVRSTQIWGTANVARPCVSPLARSSGPRPRRRKVLTGLGEAWAWPWCSLGAGCAARVEAWAADKLPRRWAGTGPGGTMLVLEHRPEQHPCRCP